MVEFWDEQAKYQWFLHPGTATVDNRAEAWILWHGLAFQVLNKLASVIKTPRDRYYFDKNDACVGYQSMRASVQFYLLYKNHVEMFQRLLDQVLLGETTESIMHIGQADVSDEKDGIVTAGTNVKKLSTKEKKLLSRLLLETR